VPLFLFQHLTLRLSAFFKLLSVFPPGTWATSFFPEKPCNPRFYFPPPLQNVPGHINLGFLGGFPNLAPFSYVSCSRFPGFFLFIFSPPIFFAKSPFLLLMFAVLSIQCSFFFLEWTPIDFYLTFPGSFPLSQTPIIVLLSFTGAMAFLTPPRWALLFFFSTAGRSSRVPFFIPLWKDPFVFFFFSFDGPFSFTHLFLQLLFHLFSLIPMFFRGPLRCLGLLWP